MERILSRFERSRRQFHQPFAHGDTKIADEADAAVVQDGKEYHGPGMADHLAGMDPAVFGRCLATDHLELHGLQQQFDVLHG